MGSISICCFWRDIDEGRGTKDEGRGTKDEGGGTKDEGRRARDTRRRTRDGLRNETRGDRLGGIGYFCVWAVKFCFFKFIQKTILYL